jgi:hypothetical protein
VNDRGAANVRNNSCRIGGCPRKLRNGGRLEEYLVYAAYDRDLAQFDRKGFQEFFAETGSDPASKLELSAFIDSNQQGAHVFPFPGRLGMAADHK